MNGALAAWRGLALDRAALAEQSRAIEVEDLGVPGGRQDHYAAAYGGALALTFGDETRVRRLPLSPRVQGIARATMHRRLHRTIAHFRRHHHRGARRLSRARPTLCCTRSAE